MTQFPPAPISDEEWAAAHIEGRWVPVTMAAAEWAAQRLSEHKARVADIQAEIDAYVRQVSQWAAERLTQADVAEALSSIELLEHGLREYARRIRAESVDRRGEPRVKTIKLPSATLETKKAVDPKPKLTVTDLNALYQWCAEHDHTDLMIFDVNVKELAKRVLVVTDSDNVEHLITGDGEEVPGVSWELDEPKEPSVTIRLHEEGQYG